MLEDKVKVGLEMAQDALVEDLPNASIDRIKELVSYIKTQNNGQKQIIGDNYELISSIYASLSQEHEYNTDYMLSLLGQIYSDIDTIFE